MRNNPDYDRVYAQWQSAELRWANLNMKLSNNITDWERSLTLSALRNVEDDINKFKSELNCMPKYLE